MKRRLQNILIVFLFAGMIGCSPKLTPLNEVDNMPLEEIEERLSFTGLTINFEECSVEREKTGVLKNVTLGKIENYEIFIESLVSNKNFNIDRRNFLVINYHPGKNLCSATGTKDKRLIRQIHGEIWAGVHTIAGVKPIYIYKYNEDLERYSGIIEWMADENKIISDNFFPIDYPCGGFLVINEQGEYVVYNGEHPIEYIWQFTRYLKERDDKIK